MFPSICCKFGAGIITHAGGGWGFEQLGTGGTD